MRLRIMCYNIQSGRNNFGRISVDEAPEVINRYSPDIVGLCEVRMFTEDLGGLMQAKYIAEKTGMHYAFAKAIDYLGGEYGVALLSRFPIESFEKTNVEQIPENERERRYEDRVLLSARVKTEKSPVRVLVSHYGLSQRERENAAKLTLSKLENEKDPAIFMGDLNMTPDNPLYFALSERLTDTAEGSTYLTHKADSLVDRIDYIFASAHFSVENAFAPFTTASDHLPIISDVIL
ncbi:MAG: endonuclease/exonuclease/phosphatase family protein [Clostridia bacterium]|nr:endonuclease/exonuclease/phosphatase family protein [Clostridia bacterium]